jgi:hypothetical protein
VHLSNLVRFSGVKEDSFGGRGFASVDMRSNANVPDEIKGVTTGHGFFSGSRF